MCDGQFPILVASGHLFKTILQLWTHVSCVIMTVLTPLTQDGVRGGPDTVPVVNVITSAQESPDKESNWRLRCKCKLM